MAFVNRSEIEMISIMMVMLIIELDFSWWWLAPVVFIEVVNGLVALSMLVRR